MESCTQIHECQHVTVQVLRNTSLHIPQFRILSPSCNSSSEAHHEVYDRGPCSAGPEDFGHLATFVFMQARIWQPGPLFVGTFIFITRSRPHASSSCLLLPKLSGLVNFFHALLCRHHPLLKRRPHWKRSQRHWAAAAPCSHRLSSSTLVLGS